MAQFELRGMVAGAVPVAGSVPEPYPIHIFTCAIDPNTGNSGLDHLGPLLTLKVSKDQIDDSLISAISYDDGREWANLRLLELFNELREPAVLFQALRELYDNGIDQNSQAWASLRAYLTIHHTNMFIIWGRLSGRVWHYPPGISREIIFRDFYHSIYTEYF